MPGPPRKLAEIAGPANPRSGPWQHSGLDVRFDQGGGQGAESFLLAAAGLLLFKALESPKDLLLDRFGQSHFRHWVENLVFLLDVLPEQRGELPHPTNPSYLYKAEVRDVIDDDTLLLDIDLGFEVIRRQRIRLARIDAPARETPEGAHARRYVREQLAVALIVGTRKADLHGRYVAHVFYAFNNRGIEQTFLEGRYLNQELVDKGFAKVV